MAVISRNLEHLGPNLALHSGTTRGTRVQNIIGISAKLRGLRPVQRSPYTFWILMRRIQTNQKDIGPTLHVGPNELGDAGSVISQVIAYTR